MEKITITSETKTLHGTLLTPKDPSGNALLFIHGWKSSEKEYIQRAKALVDLGFTCLTFNLAGHGTSEGDIEKLTRKNYLDDVIAAYDFLKKQKDVNLEKIGVVGASFGGYLAALLTTKKPVRWLAMRAPANYPDEGFAEISQMQLADSFTKRLWREKKLSYLESIVLHAVYDFRHEILLVESGKDVIVPRQTVQNYADAVKDKTKLTHISIKDADHQLSTQAQQQAFITILVEWFGKVIS